jgi:hypothetical protein
METLPWMKPDFDLRKVLAADASGAFLQSVEQAIDDLSARLDMHSFACRRDSALRERVEGLLSACETAREVIGAAHIAAHAH